MVKGLVGHATGASWRQAVEVTRSHCILRAREEINEFEARKSTCPDIHVYNVILAAEWKMKWREREKREARRIL